MPKTIRRAVAALIAVLLGTFAAVAVAAPAAAHDQLLSSFPAADTTVDVSPAEITLTFNAALNPDPTSIVIEVIGPDGENYAIDSPSVEDDVFVMQHLSDDAPNGLFTVRWKVVSSDGHPISGEYVYTVAATIVPTTAPSPTTTEVPTPEPTVSSNNDTGAAGHGEPTGGGALLQTLAAVTGALVLGGAVVVILMVARERRRRDRLEQEKQEKQDDDQ